MKFIIATGGSGGHLFPALKVAEELKGQGHGLVLLGSFDRAGDLSKTGFQFEELGAKGIVLTWRKDMFISMSAMFRAVKKAKQFLIDYKPDAIIGFGGYGAFPAVWAGILCKIPTLIHEQNVVPGRANALLAKFVKKIAVSFPKSNQFFDPNKTVLTGCPCHMPKEGINRDSILDEFNLKTERTTIFVFGGSQGSRHINEVFIQALNELKDQVRLQVIHVSGKRDYPMLKDRYNSFGIPFALFEFLDKMEEAYSIADLVVSRSGAATVSEVAGFQLPAIFIPYPYARGHQKENASVLCETNSTRIIEDNSLSAENLKVAILDMIKMQVSREGRPEARKAVCFPDAAARLADEAVKLKS